MTSGRGVRKQLTGFVVGTAMDKTAVVLVNRLTKHPTYKKYIRSRKKYMAHDPQNRCAAGDKVRIIECRPFSKRKRWQVLEILERSEMQRLAGAEEGRNSEQAT
ncbi:MAG: 30S ribosomal protein S17 [Thermodesulfobacteriota bacterium]